MLVKRLTFTSKKVYGVNRDVRNEKDEVEEYELSCEYGEGVEWVRSLQMDWMQGKAVYIKRRVGMGSKKLVLNLDGSLTYDSNI